MDIDSVTLVIGFATEGITSHFALQRISDSQGIRGIILPTRQENYA